MRAGTEKGEHGRVGAWTSQKGLRGRWLEVGCRCGTQTACEGRPGHRREATEPEKRDRDRKRKVLLIDEWKGRGEDEKDLAVREPKVSTVVETRSYC